MFCQYCGTQVPDGNTNCTNCGAALTAGTTNAQSANTNYQAYNQAYLNLKLSVLVVGNALAKVA